MIHLFNARLSGDIHLNDQMTWTDRVLSDDEIKVNDFIRPNLYSIVLHEFGHSLGLRYNYIFGTKSCVNC